MGEIDTKGAAKAVLTQDFTDRAWRFDLNPQMVRDNHQFESDYPCHWSIFVYYGSRSLTSGLVYASAESQDLGAGPFLNWTEFDVLNAPGNLGLTFSNLIPIQGKLLQAYGRSIKVSVELRSDSETSAVFVLAYKNQMYRPFTITRPIQPTVYSSPVDFATHICFMPLDGNVASNTFVFRQTTLITLATIDLPLGNQSSQGVYFPIPPLTKGILETTGEAWIASYKIFG